MRKMFPLNVNNYKPSATRVNYSIANFKNKIYIYGGMDEDNKMLQSMDEFDAMTYKFQNLKYRGGFTPKGR